MESRLPPHSGAAHLPRAYQVEMVKPQLALGLRRSQERHCCDLMALASKQRHRQLLPSREGDTCSALLCWCGRHPHPTSEVITPR